jgi:hypothetical protein
MSARAKYVIGAIVALLLLILLPGPLKLLVLAVPVVGYFMLDSSQRRRLRRITRRQIGR